MTTETIVHDVGEEKVDRAERLDRLIFVGLLVTVVFATLAHGSVEPWSVAMLGLMATVLGLLWTAKLLARRRLRIYVPVIAYPLFGLIALGLAQSLTFTGDQGQRLSLSMDVEATRIAVAVLVVLSFLFLLAWNLLRGRDRFRAFAYFLVIFGLAFSIFAIVQHFTWDGSFFWIRPNTQGATPFGSFVNRNHYAGFVEMLVPIPIALVLARAIRGEARVFFLFAAVLMGSSVIISLSRGGLVSLSAGLLFLGFLSGRLKTSVFHGSSGLLTLIRLGVTLAMLAAIGLGVVWMGADPVVERLSKSVDRAGAEGTYLGDGREWIWRDTVRMIGDNPMTGVGLGAYATAHPIYTESDGSLLVSYAHNDYLQVLSDAGVIGAVLAIWFLVLVCRHVFVGLSTRDPLLSGLAAGCGAGIFAILVHSLFDFNLQLPSNALLFLLLVAVITRVGTIVTVGRSARHYSTPRSQE